MADVFDVLSCSATRAIFDRSGAGAVYLFGSRATGRAGPSSDVDLGVLFPPGGDAGSRFDGLVALERELKPLLPVPLDLVSLLDADALLQFEAVVRGRLVYSRDEEAAFLHELRVRHGYEEFCHIQEIFTEAMKRRLGVVP
ncbi:MAG: nucleotidyltransferase domain-containing protein [Planctomycetes bacterium]|nr:nucleotidyltransferase domain-containing protein [Planctomycetota bacterium]